MRVIKIFLSIFCYFSISICLNSQATIEAVFSATNVNYVNRSSAVNSKGYFYSVFSVGDQVSIFETGNSNRISRIKSIKTQYDVITRDICIDANDNIYISGYLSGTSRIWVIKLDKDLNVLWSNFYGNNVNYYVGGMSVNSDEIINIVGIDRFPSVQQVSFSLLIGKDGSTIKYEKFAVDATEYEALYSSIPVGNSGFILIGTGGIYNTNRYPLWITRIDVLGNIIWSKFWIQSETDFDRGIFPASIVKYNDREFVVFGRKGDDRNGTNSNPKEINTILFKIDLDGNILTFKEFKSQPNIFNYSFGGAYDGNNYYFAGSNGLLGNGAFVAKLDQQFNVISARADDRFGLLFTDVETNRSRVYFSGIKRNQFGNYQNWYLNADKNFDKWCEFKDINLTSFDYSPVPMNFGIKKSTGSTTEPFIILANEEYCIQVNEETVCPLTGLPYVTQEIMIGLGQKSSISGLDSAYCNEDKLISLVGKGSPLGGKFFLNGVEVNSINPGLLSPNTKYILKYYAKNAGECSDTAYHSFTVYPKPEFQIKASNACVGERLTVSVDPTGSGNSFNWDFGGARIISGSGEGPYQVIFDSPGTKTIKAKENSLFCGSLEKTFPLTISQVLIKTSNDTTIIQGSFVDMSVAPLNGAKHSFSWSPNVELSCNDCPNPRATPKRTTKYTVTVTDLDTGCKATGCITIRTSCCK